MRKDSFKPARTAPGSQLTPQDARTDGGSLVTRPQRHASCSRCPLRQPSLRLLLDPANCFALRNEARNVLAPAVWPYDTHVPTRGRRQAPRFESRIRILFEHDEGPRYMATPTSGSPIAPRITMIRACGSRIERADLKKSLGMINSLLAFRRAACPCCVTTIGEAARVAPISIRDGYRSQDAFRRAAARARSFGCGRARAPGDARR